MIQQTFVHNKSQNWYIIPNWRNNKERKLNMQINIKTKNGKELWLQTLVDSGCTHMRIDKQLVKEKRIKMEPMDRSFKVFNVDGTKNGEITRFALLEVEIDRHKKRIDAVVTDLNGMDMFLEYDWLVKHNLEVDWNKRTIKSTICPRTCRTNH